MSELRRVHVNYGVKIPGLTVTKDATCTCALEPGRTDESDIPLMIGIRLGVPADAVIVKGVRDV